MGVQSHAVTVGFILYIDAKQKGRWDEDMVLTLSYTCNKYFQIGKKKQNKVRKNCILVQASFLFSIFCKVQKRAMQSVNS